MSAPQIPDFVIRHYARQISILSERIETRRQAVAMYGNTSRARLELGWWTEDNRDRFDAARYELQRIASNAPVGVTMADVKAAAQEAADPSR